jgi:hypothetical protein
MSGDENEDEEKEEEIKRGIKKKFSLVGFLEF